MGQRKICFLQTKVILNDQVNSVNTRLRKVCKPLAFYPDILYPALCNRFLSRYLYPTLCKTAPKEAPSKRTSLACPAGTKYR